MARSHATPVVTVPQLLERIHKVFDNSPLRQLLPLLEETAVAAANAPNAVGDKGYRSCVNLIKYYERAFTNGFGSRFALDAWLVRDLCTRWSNASVSLPSQIIPVYGEEWAYSLLPSPWEKSHAREIYAISFIGTSDIADFRLLNYPWLCHELGHHLLAKAGDGFTSGFQQALDDFVKSALRKSIADSPELKNRKRDLARRVNSLWAPIPNQYDWAHEIAADAIALWTCGPAFLSAMQDALESDDIDPFQVAEGHPPYELRLRVLLELACDLEWNTHCKPLQDIVESWCASERFATRDSNYLALADNNLAESCRDQAVRACRSWQLPQCTPEMVQHIQTGALARTSFDSAAELVVAAWSVNANAPQAYPAWEKAAGQQLLSDLNSDS